jgi:hypothetical protein
MLYTPTDPNTREPNRDHVPTAATDSLTPGSANSKHYLLRSNLPGLSLEIENPDTELPVLTFDFEVD